MELEIWKPIGVKQYMISNFGRVKGITGEKLMKPQCVGDGHFQVCILNDGVKKNWYVHRLVGLFFLETPDSEDKILIDHIDRNKANNNVINLRWVSYSGNCLNRKDNIIETPQVLKNRAYCRAYKLLHSEMYREHQQNYRAKKNLIMKNQREISKAYKLALF